MNSQFSSGSCSHRPPSVFLELNYPPSVNGNGKNAPSKSFCVFRYDDSTAQSLLRLTFVLFYLVNCRPVELILVSPLHLLFVSTREIAMLWTILVLLVVVVTLLIGIIESRNPI